MPMRYYPLFLDLTDARCLVVGAGPVGRRKIASLLECRPLSLLVLDPNLDDEALDKAVAHLPHDSLIRERRAFRAEDVERKNLVFAATPSAAVNSAVAALCRAAGVLCNVAGPREDGADGNFLVPAHVENGPLTLALSTSGCSPALARALKEDLEQWIQGGYAPLAMLLKALRPKLLALGLGSDADAEIFRALCAKPLRERLMEALLRKDAPLADALMAPHLPASLSFSAKEIFHGLD
ncbi:precorrin-2 dehydrogenase/sirohydrochlorin ferrochelatase family protein [Mailhella massiliensis]|uniref:precorrin-2 dehydrogenase/sirohydrochlorin ferrochelatase family protein n=1 Tax=Mailhella massiliensis TaxID=1903261 RepID=UPI002356A3F8|nr:bifunctional precorrin-2 dehydrogenase/sirohydrochlorin ferrochelatase [Mailhella massiliensis]